MLYITYSDKPLSADELRILNIVLVEYLGKLKHIGLCLEAGISDPLASADRTGIDKPATDQPVITKKRVVECLQQIGQNELAGILIKRQGKTSIYLNFLLWTPFTLIFITRMITGLNTVPTSHIMMLVSEKKICTQLRINDNSIQ